MPATVDVVQDPAHIITSYSRLRHICRSRPPNVVAPELERQPGQVALTLSRASTPVVQVCVPLERNAAAFLPRAATFSTFRFLALAASFSASCSRFRDGRKFSNTHAAPSRALDCRIFSNLGLVDSKYACFVENEEIGENVRLVADEVSAFAEIARLVVIRFEEQREFGASATSAAI